MPYTLQRKMFKLGGSVAHGGGITANLKDPNRIHMNKGGSVAPIGLVGKGPVQMKGPDGKMREMQNPAALLPLLFAGGRTAFGLGRALLGRGAGKGITQAAKNFFKVKPTGKVISGSGRTMPYNPAATSSSRALVPSSGRASAEMAKRALKESGGFRTLGMSPDRLRQLATITGAGVGGAGMVGGVSSLFPEFQDSPDDTLLENIVDPIRGITEGAFDLATGLPVMGAQVPFRKLEDIQGGSEIIRTALYGAPEKPKIGEITGAKVAAAEVKSKEDENAEMLANLRDRSDAYLKLLNDEGRQDMTVGNIGRAISASASGLLNEDYGAAAAAFTDSLGGSMDADRAEQRQLEMAAKELAIGDMKTEEERAYNAEQAEQQLYTAAMLEGNTEQGIRTRKLLAAAEQAGGLENITELPMKANGKEIDTKEMKRGAIYTDTVGASTKTFIAVSLSGEAQEFDSYEKAVEFSNSGSA